MSKITRIISTALKNNVKKSVDNSCCTGRRVFLFGNEIARITDGKLQVTLAGWPTVTTRERLNGILAEFGCDERFYQRDGKQYFGTREIRTIKGWLTPVRSDQIAKGEADLKLEAQIAGL